MSETRKYNEAQASVRLDGGTQRCCNKPECGNNWPCALHSEAQLCPKCLRPVEIFTASGFCQNCKIYVYITGDLIGQPIPSGGERRCPRIYAASRASVAERPAMWKRLRAKGNNIISSWIDEVEAGATADLGELWTRIFTEIASADRLVLYVEPNDFPLKGAFIEVGMALGMGKPVYVVAPDCKFDAPSYRPIGSWVRHPSVKISHNFKEALGHDQPTPAQPKCKWWCPTCEVWLESVEVTFEETHDPRLEGCGGKALWQPVIKNAPPVSAEATKPEEASCPYVWSVCPNPLTCEIHKRLQQSLDSMRKRPPVAPPGAEGAREWYQNWLATRPHRDLTCSDGVVGLLAEYAASKLAQKEAEISRLWNDRQRALDRIDEQSAEISRLTAEREGIAKALMIDFDGFLWSVGFENKPDGFETLVAACQALYEDADAVQKAKDELVAANTELRTALTKMAQGYRNLAELQLLTGPYAEDAKQYADEAERLAKGE